MSDGPKNHDERYVYVDVHYQDKEKDRQSKWRRVRVEEVDAFRQKYRNYNVFATINRFANKSQTQGEHMYMDMYFDLDYDNDPSIALRDARKLRDYFHDMGMAGEDVRFYFSGSKGFHVLVNRQVLGVEPRPDLHQICKYVALYLNQLLSEGSDSAGDRLAGLPSLDYGSIYSSRRMLRLVDSVHQKTQLFKVELLPSELEWSLGQIREYARQPRGERYDNPTFTVNPTAAAWFKRLVVECEERHKLAQQRISEQAFEQLKHMTDYPLCYQDVIANGIKKAGDRNKATMALASYLKDAGIDLSVAQEELVNWADTIPDNLTSTPRGNARAAATRSTVKAVYEGDYHFGCQFMLSLHGDGKKGRVACKGQLCPLHQSNREEEQAIPVHLADSAGAEYVGKKVSMNILVSGKLDTPYQVPRRVRFYCGMASTCEKVCALRDGGGTVTVEYPDSDRILIEATHKDDNLLKGVIKQSMTGIGCKNFSFEVEKFCNVEELLAVPMAERVTTVNVDASGKIVPEGDPTAKGRKDVDETGREFVSRKIYVVADDENKNRVLTNNYYRIEGYVYPHPKTQQGTVLATTVVPVDDSLQQFRMTPELLEAFKVLQVPKGKELSEHVDFILQDLTENVTRVWRREEYLLSVLLTFHSVIAFPFQRETEPRGWVEMLAVGDTGQAKTKLLKTLMDFGGLGSMSHGVSATRTGLIYSVQQQGERWFVVAGSYVLADRKLLAVDEFAELPEDDQQKLRVGRSEGMIRVEHAARMEFNTRVRLVLLSNPRYGKQLREFTHGVESLKELWKAAADIRRLDLCVFLKTSDITASGEDVINAERPYPEKQYIDAHTFKQSILWAWSRRPEQIRFARDAEKTCLDAAARLSVKYGAADDLPLVSPADQRIKLARLAVALAALTHSTDDAHETVIVKKEHVEYVELFLQHVYDAPNCRYDVYARYAREETELTEEERLKVADELDDIGMTFGDDVGGAILDLYRRNDVWRTPEIRDLTNLDSGETNSVLRVLSQHHMIRRTKAGFQKLPKFVEYLEKM